MLEPAKAILDLVAALGPNSTLEKVLKGAIELKRRFPALQIRVYDAQGIPGTRSRPDGSNAITCQHRHHPL